ncbi:hypothetical protein E4K67_11885 [Desulfosporosinus fructosivorans]|uniref:Uncharacterized protein n=1 Tax=Desulfosporosinus fructosivorans TaxID=2018669 RepID=A0A4Z0R725_9FIRM|nr:hypothetical protein [Desulfosporosinus fructosivorans]TGE38610.1 hypothetical protein E4K67_11885 [Desulfosporosinus fructosivorans]
MKKVRATKRKFKKAKKAIMAWLVSRSHIILYCFGFAVGIALIVLSFKLKENWINVSSGVGTGLLTSLVVSISINYKNDKRQERKLLEDKRLVLSDIINVSINIYRDVVYRINEYVMFSNIPPKSFYGFYDDFSSYNEFEDYLKKLDVDKLSESERTHLKTLLNIGNNRIDYLVAELKRLPKHEYYLKGLLTKDEFNGLTSNFANDAYMDYAEHINDFWNDGIINYEKCVRFLRMTLYICSKIIASIQYCRADVIEKEESIKDEIGQRYYEEIYLQSDEYIEKQIEQAQARDEYYAAHPEEYEELERQFEEWQNETPEDRILKDLYYSICGISAYRLEDLLGKLDSNSEKSLLFLTQDNIQRSLKKSWKKRKAIKRKFGNDYLQKAEKLNKDKTNG